MPAPDPMRQTIPKAYVVLAAGFEPNAATAASIFDHCASGSRPISGCAASSSPNLPKTASGKIRRVELRRRESALAEAGERAAREFRIEDFPET